MTVEPLLADSRAKLRAALELVFASADGYVPFAPSRSYPPREREPYDALSDRFLRAFESSLKFFRTWERVREADVSETFRDLLLRMEKVGLISDLATWIALRDLRNRVVHDYLPNELAALYAAIIEEAVPELRRLDAAITDRLR
ncbi:MAG: nucleotidyltransferase substrate binding protein [Planctomycetota bacterium]